MRYYSSKKELPGSGSTSTNICELTSLHLKRKLHQMKWAYAYTYIHKPSSISSFYHSINCPEFTGLALQFWARILRRDVMPYSSLKSSSQQEAAVEAFWLIRMRDCKYWYVPNKINNIPIITHPHSIKVAVVTTSGLMKGFRERVNVPLITLHEVLQKSGDIPMQFAFGPLTLIIWEASPTNSEHSRGRRGRSSSTRVEEKRK